MPPASPEPRAAWDASVSERFRDSARLHPDALAVRGSGHELTYAGLDAAANGIARAVRQDRPWRRCSGTFASACPAT